MVRESEICDHPAQLTAATLDLMVVHSISKEATIVKAFFSTSGRMLRGGAGRLLEFQEPEQMLADKGFPCYLPGVGCAALASASLSSVWLYLL
ncbi:hypothetical protein Ancab_033562 [Ancistrocladus abbreviatus]